MNSVVGKRKKRGNGLDTLAAMVAMAAASGVDFSSLIKEPDRSERESNRMKLTSSEFFHLGTLSGKKKKQYIKELRAKYSKGQV